MEPAQWIGQGAGTLQSWESPVRPSPLFRREFSIPGGIRRATLRICGLGYYEVRLNGSKIGDHVLDPIVTQYDRRVRAVSYEIDSVLQGGNNCLGVMLGNGWYNCHTADVWHFDKAPWRDYPKLLLWLEMELQDGQTLRVVSGPEWKAMDGPVRFDGLRNGETYDARLDCDGWDRVGYDDHEWRAALVVPGPGGLTEEQTSPPCKVMETLDPVAVSESRPGILVYDMGQNIAGWARIRLEVEAGTQITLRYSDRLTPEGEVDQDHIGIFVKSGNCQTDRYIAKGKEIEEWEPRFTYHGFQYVQVEGFPQGARPVSVQGRVVHTAFEPIGSFTCSSEDINRLQACTLRSYVGNFVGIPTDCPHREKNGWTGDAQLAAETGLMNFDAASSYRQWLDSIADTQRPSGQLPGIVPSSGWGYNWGSGPAWDNAFMLLPWYLYLYTGNADAIHDHYDGMKRYMDFCDSMATGDLLSFGLGDWCPVSEGRMPEVTLTSSLYYYTDACLMRRYALLSGRDGDAAFYKALSERIQYAFNDRFYKGDGIYGKGEMTALGGALYNGLAEDTERPAVARRLAQTVEANQGKPDFGILGAKWVPRALAVNGYAGLAFRLISQPEYPGWVHWLRNGATTLHESWDSSNSLNHIMFGDISAWMYHVLAGIRPDAEFPGFQKIRIQPVVIEELDWVRAEYRSTAGTIASAWERKKGIISFRTCLPEGTEGELVLPDGSITPLHEGAQCLAFEN